MRGLRTLASLGLLLLTLTGLGLSLQSALLAGRINRDLRLMAQGRDIAVAPDAPLPLIEGRALWLLTRGRMDEAEALGPLFDSRGDSAALARWQFNRGNARLRAGFDLIAAGQAEAAIAEVTLAKSAYRAALRADPGDFAAKTNFELAQRLVRDLPRPEPAGDEALAPPRPLWTDLPGTPGGLP